MLGRWGAGARLQPAAGRRRRRLVGGQSHPCSRMQGLPRPPAPAAAASLTVTDGRVAELSLAELRAAGLDEERHPDAAVLIKVRAVLCWRVPPVPGGSL